MPENVAAPARGARADARSTGPTPPAAERLITGAFVAVTAVTLLFFLYVGILVPVMPRLVEDHLGGSEFDIGLNLAVFSLSAIAVRPLLGPWGDRYGRRALMIGGALVAAAGAAAAAFVGDRWSLLPLRALSGLGEGALFVGGSTLVSDLAPAHRRAEAASYFSVAVFGGLGVGPILGEALVGDDHYARGLLVAAGCALAAAVFALRLPRHRATAAAHQPARPSLPATLAAGEETMRKLQPAALRPGAVLALGMAGFATFNAFLPEHARDVGLDGSKWVFATYSVVCLVMRVLGAKLPERLGLERAVNGALVFLTLGLLALFGLGSATGVFLGATLLGIGMSFMYPALMAMTVNAVSERQRSRAISTFTMFFDVGTAFGGLAFGFVAELSSKRGGFLAGAVSTTLGLWVLWRVLLPAQRRLGGTRPIPAGGGLGTPAH